MSNLPRTATEYRRWWEQNTSVAYGSCWCGCSQKTTVPTKTSRKIGRIKGEPMRFLSGHANRKGQIVSPDEYRRRWSEERPELPFGYCCCGCGEQTQLAPETAFEKGWVAGQPRRYLYGHHSRVVLPSLGAEIARRYASGESATKLAAELGCNRGTINRALKKHGVEIRSPQEAAKSLYTCDHSYFNVIDTQEKAYWLGFIGADGCVIVKDNTRMLQVKLAARDAEHLASLRDALQSDYPIYPLFPVPQDPRALQIRSPGLVEGLAKHGIHPRKTTIYEWPDFLPDELLRHYLRGYFDGDGSFSFSRNYPRFAVEGQERFLQGCQGFLMRSLGVSKTRMGRHSGAFELAYGGGRQVPRIARWLYVDATVYLSRKHRKVAHLL